ncbi:PepSY domain-containing protein [Marinomonas ostreistagni]|uniref:PepSY domain-containing protein n=1 Tax=Marinomonas ostreistagni TaxID=359209 RepID=UPI0019528FB2|nr:PepSY domain-containing protein [Marinomonas ostreistagni]MBM6551855.1 PepSY domain-containing protein [Marinomonas ostreistagni]
MKKLLTMTTALLATATISTAGFAEETRDDLRKAQASNASLSAQLETMGYEVNELDLDRAIPVSRKLDMVEDQNDELRDTLNDLKLEN